MWVSSSLILCNRLQATFVKHSTMSSMVGGSSTWPRLAQALRAFFCNSASWAGSQTINRRTLRPTEPPFAPGLGLGVFFFICQVLAVGELGRIHRNAEI